MCTRVWQGEVGAGWQRPDLPMSHLCTAQQQAHPSVLMRASTCWDVRGGGGGEVFATPLRFLFREPLFEVYGGMGVGMAMVMVMQQLMEISCQDSVSVWVAGSPGGGVWAHCGDTKALAPVLPNKQSNN